MSSQVGNGNANVGRVELEQPNVQSLHYKLLQLVCISTQLLEACWTKQQLETGSTRSNGQK